MTNLKEMMKTAETDENGNGYHAKRIAEKNAKYLTGEHTPGPWKHSRETDGKYWFIRPEKSGEFGTESKHLELARVTVAGQDFNDHNARLIAAAPELLAACKLAMEYCEAGAVERGPDDEPSLISVLEDVLAKATGETI